MPESLGFQGRMTTSHNNNASDPVNAALNYSYGCLKIEVRKAISALGLEPAVGYLHEISRQQTAESLVYDLMEPYRWLADLCVVRAFETSALTRNDFAYERDDYLYRIMWGGRMRFLDIFREAFNTGATYNDQSLNWDTVIERKALELSRFLTGKSDSIDFCEPAPTLERQDNREVTQRILSLSQHEASKLGIGRSTLHYLRKRSRSGQGFKVYGKVLEKITHQYTRTVS
jgi:CRISPR-associated protein Cas1